MVHEIAQIEVRPGTEEEFERAVDEAVASFKSAKGCRSLRLERSVEHPSRYRLVVGWDSVEAHIVDFRESEGFQTWRALVGPFFASPPQVEHVETVLTGF